MSRSKHTRPKALRAKDRLRAPREARGVDDFSRRNLLRRLLKEQGLQWTEEHTGEFSDHVFPRVTEKKARPGFHHPASEGEVVEFLRGLAPEHIYGIRSVELRRGRDGDLSLGQLRVPGTIILFDQSPSPWRMVGRLSDSQQQRLENGGADLEQLEGGVLVHWPEGKMRDFMLFHVLLHEMGHHHLQHYKGKREARVARTADHEEFAETFARRCREAYGLGDT